MYQYCCILFKFQVLSVWLVNLCKSRSIGNWKGRGLWLHWRNLVCWFINVSYAFHTGYASGTHFLFITDIFVKWFELCRLISAYLLKRNLENSLPLSLYALSSLDSRAGKLLQMDFTVGLSQIIWVSIHVNFFKK